MVAERTAHGYSLDRERKPGTIGNFIGDKNKKIRSQFGKDSNFGCCFLR